MTEDFPFQAHKPHIHTWLSLTLLSNNINITLWHGRHAFNPSSLLPRTPPTNSLQNLYEICNPSSLAMATTPSRDGSRSHCEIRNPFTKSSR
ncbi:hypothetical protein glysoja_019141 [Glycine soja]|nr:hypothetical protein JHK86_007622 [Glycine max]KHN10710.1 hypothetical protein glysoja_019141 [Glycine soja]